MKKVYITVIQIGGLYTLFKLGEWLQKELHLFIPGSIIGMLILFVMLQFKIVKEKWLSEGANWLLAYLPLLFVPATVGIIQYLPYFQGKGFLSVAIVIFSTLLVLIISGGLGQALVLREKRKRAKSSNGEKKVMM